MTQTPDPDQPGNDDTTPLPPGPPPAPHGDPVAGDQQWGQAPPPPPPGAEQGWQPQYQDQYPPAAPPQPQYQQGYGQPGYGQPGYAQPGYPQGQPGAPYGIHPGTGIPYSEKSKLVAGLLQIFISGVGRMYMGQVGLGVAQLCVAIFTCGIGALWSVIDGILILTKDDPRDAQGLILKS